jgi:RNA polymerase sigma-70 factor (ECF subfamily)
VQLRDGRLVSKGVTFLTLGDSIYVASEPLTFHELYSRYAGDVFRFAHWLAGNAEEARDITSETFVRAWTAAAEPRGESIKAYLFTIARNLHRKQWRRASRNELLSEDLADPQLRPDEAAANRDEVRQAMAALRVLSELDRTVLLLRAEEGLSYEDIATVTGLSVSAAKVRVFRARGRRAALMQNPPSEKNL